jgi:hypothetical protein
MKDESRKSKIDPKWVKCGRKGDWQTIITKTGEDEGAQPRNYGTVKIKGVNNKMRTILTMDEVWKVWRSFGT